MGYDSKLYFIEKSSLSPDENHDNKTFGIFQGEVEMHVCPDIQNMFEQAPPTSVYFYGDDGNVPLERDAYGDELKELDLCTFIENVKYAKDFADYYPLQVAKAMAEAYFLGAQERFGRRMVVVHYGH